jgi:endonuclease-3
VPAVKVGHPEDEMPSLQMQQNFTGTHPEFMMTVSKKVALISKVLDSLYPKPPIPLNFKDTYTLLIAVLLSAQCTDKRVNLVTPKLFALADTPLKMSKQKRETIEAIIRPCGLAPAKSKHILELSKKLLADFGGQVPCTFKALESLPGVGHKTASVVMVHAFKIPAFPVGYTYPQTCGTLGSE